ncbi:G-protein coupled receptor 183-like [Paramacrobiotus metropolitanus]|uniref:G-protein coupled receptor 183-like n=1 Tax=Paramacrobiotus metropolitanus TaxID=2943436 RepID=UPI0024463454|nr:G-protein coupled receptor 183-like [Paramacrobiotus metropolitanus]
MVNNSSLFISSATSASQLGIVELFNLFTAVIGGLLNTAVLITFVTNRASFTPFTIYLINLLIANFIETACAKLCSFLSFICPQCRTHSVCDLCLFSSYLAMAGMINSHLIISFNRLWAVIHPHHYKIHHTKVMAGGICAVMWMYIIATVLPQLVRDSLYFREPFAAYGRCKLKLNAQPVLYLATLLVVYIIPEVVILLTFPVIWHKRQRHRKILHRTLSQPPTNSASAGTGGRTTVNNHTESSRSQKKSMQVLVILMISMVICWTPLLGATLAANFIDFTNKNFFNVATCLFAVEAVTDPILFGLVFNQHVFKNLKLHWKTRK